MTAVGSDCPYVNVTGAGDGAFNGLYVLDAALSNERPRWVSPAGGIALQFHPASEAETWFGAGTGAVYALVDKSHKYLARGGALLSAPTAGWELRSKKSKDPPPSVRCASLPPACARARISGSGLSFASGSVLTRQPATGRSAAAGAASSWFRYTIALSIDDGLKWALPCARRAWA